MGPLLGLISILGFLTCLVMCGVSSFKKNKPKAKKFGIGIGLSFILFIAAMAVNPSTPQSPTVNKDNKTAASSSEEKKDASSSTSTSSEKATNPAPADNKTAVSGNLKIHFIDVGQADSILIQDNGKNMLIDAGNNPDGPQVVSYLKSQGVSKLDVVVGTHVHEDHIGGMDTVLNSFDVGQIYLPKQTTTTKTFEDVLKAIKNKGLKITAPVTGSTFKLNQAEAMILAPNKDSYEDINNSSIAIRLTYGDNHFMLMGDAESVSESEILGKGFDISADLLKVGHHGSSSSTSQAFLNKVNPKFAVVMVGKGNTYGHPTKETMDKLQGKSIKVYRTDECGTVVATSDGKNITFSTKEGSYNYASLNAGSDSSSSGSSGGIIPSPAPTPTPQPSTPPANSDNSRTVFYTPSGKSYHYSKECRTLAKSKTILSQTLGEALGSTHNDPCNVCVK